jgi:hypothetical protein
VFPRITNGKVYVPIGGELEDGTMIDGLVELPPEDPSYDAIKAWLIQVELGEWALKGILPGLAMSTRDRASSIQSLKQSLPELSDAAFDKVYRQFFIRAHLELLGYEARGEDWDDILDCFAAERERRYGRVASKL